MPEALMLKLAFDFDLTPELEFAFAGRWTEAQQRGIQVELAKLRALALQAWCGVEVQRWAWFACGSFRRLAQNLEFDIELGMPLMAVDWGWSTDQLEHALAIVHGARLRFLARRSVVR